MPTISVLMGVYNCAPYVDEAIESILQQSFSDFEFIICDDGSTDNTREKVYRWAERDHRIVFLENGVNRGLGFTLNRCIDTAKGKYCVRMDGDDISDPSRFERLVAEIENRPDFAVIGSNAHLFDDSGIWGEAVFKYIPDKIDAFMQRTLSHATVIMRSDALRSVGGYRPESDCARAEDYDLWCRMAENNYKMMTLQEKLYSVRWDKSNYYTRRPFKTRLAWARLVRYWHKRLNVGLRGYPKVVATYIKVFTPNFIKNLYHKVHLRQK